MASRRKLCPMELHKIPSLGKTCMAPGPTPIEGGHPWTGIHILTLTLNPNLQSTTQVAGPRASRSDLP